MRAVVLAALMLHGVAACSDSSSSTEPAVPTALEVVSGDEQETLSDSRHLPDPLRVRVMDQHGEPVEGVRVYWSATVGPISPWAPVTDESGVVAAGWTLSDTFPVMLGAHSATAHVPGVGSVTFTAYIRFGLSLEGVSFSPDEVDITSGSAAVSVSVGARNDFGSVHGPEVTFTSPSGEETIRETASFELIEGTIHEGVWEGTVVFPEGAEAGVWRLSVLFVDGYRADTGARVWTRLTGVAMESRGWPVGLTVTAN